MSKLGVWGVSAVVALVVSAAVSWSVKQLQPAVPGPVEIKINSEGKKIRVIRGTGYVRGSSQRTLKNKYAGYVSKVNFYSQHRVKKGDVILEYDDLALRTSIAKIKHDITELEQSLVNKKIVLQLTRIDPLPSGYRNLKLKREIAQERLKRHSHELEVYEQLFGSKIVSDLTLREKRQQIKDYEGDLLCLDSDIKVLNNGLEKMTVRQAEESVKDIELKIANLRRELALQEEELKYYKFVAPVDGVCITNSDTVGGYDAVGTSAAVVHRDNRKLIYAYFDERDIRHVVEGKPCRFISNQYGKDVVFEVMPYEVKRSFYSYGDRLMMYAKFRLTKEPKPLRIEDRVDRLGGSRYRRIGQLYKRSVTERSFYEQYPSC
ncbi:MAG: hypothetical protein IKA65_11995 [Lentisphaeria bacterium]|nr:hypothetical protein [Lentisphaeria bacterium]